MAKGKQDRERTKQKKLERRRRREKSDQLKSMSVARQPTTKLADKLSSIHELIEARRYSEADQLLDRLYERYSRYPAVVEAQVLLYQEMRDHERCARAAKQLTKLTPRDPDAWMMYAQESMYCGRLGIALTNYRLILQRWPGHKNVEKAKLAIELVEPEFAKRMQAMKLENGTDDYTALELVVELDKALECLHGQEFESALEACLSLIRRAPKCIAARNNLSLCYFQSGQPEKAVHVAEETYQLAPDNRFAEATLGKLLFLSANEVEANAYADRLVANPPSNADPLAATFELLGFLGRDDDILVLSGLVESGDWDSRSQAVMLHHVAVAQCRLGNVNAARSTWKQCLKAMPGFLDVRQNLEDLDSGGGHAPWHESCDKWMPRTACERMLSRNPKLRDSDHSQLVADYPALRVLIPALLDRGDPIGRQLAVSMAIIDKSPAMLDVLRKFALSSRGPDSLRQKALNFLHREGHVDAGPHRFYSRGEWIQMQQISQEIDFEPAPCPAWESKLADVGVQAMRDGDFTVAEQCFHQILQRDPDNCRAAYNLCMVYLNRDGEPGRWRAQTRLEELHKQFPDYLFAATALARLAAIDHDFERARDLILPAVTAKRLHISEAIALYSTQIEMALEMREFELAEKQLSFLIQIAGENDACIPALRRRIQHATRKTSLFGAKH